MAVDGLGHLLGVLVVSAGRWPAPRLGLVNVAHGQAQVLHPDHNCSLNEVSVHGVSHPASPGLYLKTALPLRMVGIDLVPEGWCAILPEEDGALQLVHLLLAGLDLEPDFPQIGNLIELPFMFWPFGDLNISLSEHYRTYFRLASFPLSLAAMAARK